MSTTHQTRRESYDAVLPDIKTRQDIILAILGDREMTAHEIARELHAGRYTPNIERNYAAPRLNELMNAGKIRAIGKRRDPVTGRSGTVFARIKGGDTN